MRILLALVLLAGCGDDDSTPTRDSGADSGECSEGQVQCRGRDVFVCSSGVYGFQESCGDLRVCALDLGCRDCQPGRPFCDGNDVRICGDDGMMSTLMTTCDGTSMCLSGSCMDPCADAATRGGENGCAFVGPAGGAFLTLVNRQDLEVQVTIDEGGGGMSTETIMPLRSNRISTPDDTVRISSSAPINVVAESDQDAALWLPTHLHEARYRVMSWPGDPSQVIVVSNIATTVRVTPAIDAMVGATATAAGATTAVDVTPLEQLVVSAAGDLTGTLIEADAPVGVFIDTFGQAPLDATAPAHPDGAPAAWNPGRMTEQLLPVDLWGSSFYVALAPTRVDHPTYREPEVIRVLADQSTNVTTSLPAPDDSFALGSGEFRDVFAQDDIVIEASSPVSVAQILVSPQWLVTPIDSRAGSAVMALVPALEHQRRFFYFTALGTIDNTLVARVPTGSPLRFDGTDLDGLEECSRGAETTIAGTAWELVTCIDVPVGSHLIDSEEADIVGSFFGNDADRSYAMPIGGNYR